MLLHSRTVGKSFRRFPLSGGTVLLAAQLMIAAAPTAASEAPTLTSNSSELDTARTKSVDAYCPEGTVVVSGGYFIAGGGGKVGVRYAVPARMRDNRYAFRVQGASTSAESSWRLYAYALCAPEPPGYEIVRNPRRHRTTSSSTEVACPAGKRVLGIGGVSSGTRDTSSTVLEEMQYQSYRRVKVTAGRNGRYSGRVRVRAFATCADVDTELVRRTSPTNKISPKSLSRDCPDDTHLYGVGVSVDRESIGGPGPTGQPIVLWARLKLSSILPITPGGTLWSPTASVRERATTIGDPPWSMTLRLMCGS